MFDKEILLFSQGLWFLNISKILSISLLINKSILWQAPCTRHIDCKDTNKRPKSPSLLGEGLGRGFYYAIQLARHLGIRVLGHLAQIKFNHTFVMFFMVLETLQASYTGWSASRFIIILQLSCKASENWACSGFSKPPPIVAIEIEISIAKLQNNFEMSKFFRNFFQRKSK